VEEIEADRNLLMVGESVLWADSLTPSFDLDPSVLLSYIALARSKGEGEGTSIACDKDPKVAL